MSKNRKVDEAMQFYERNTTLSTMKNVSKRTPNADKILMEFVENDLKLFNRCINVFKLNVKEMKLLDQRIKDHNMKVVMENGKEKK